MRRRSLVGTMARTAVISGTATAVSNKVTMKQMDKAQAQQAVGQQAQPVSAPKDDLIVQLEQLAELKNKGILTEEEFQAKKKQILGI